MSSWWLLWVMFMFVFVVSPLGYGWAYRGWGLPYPSYVQRRRAQRASLANDSPAFNHRSWGWSGDLIWLVVVIGMFWAVFGFWRY